MGELGGMSTGFPNQQRDFCQDGFNAEHPSHPQQLPYQNYEPQVPYQIPAGAEYNHQPLAEWVPFPYEEPSQSPMPMLQVVEEPITKIRFRYQSERGSHGSMAGRKSTNTQKSWPTVRLLNYPVSEAGEVKVRASLYTEDRCKSHVHKLLGKNCNQVPGDCVLPLQQDMTCSFPSLGVLFTEKKRVHEVLLNRKVEECGGPVDEEIKRQLSDEAKQEAKEMKLNTIRICFQAYNKNNEPITAQVFSEPVHNLKSPDSGELKITRLSRCSSRSDGGDEVFLLCEKVNKKDIKIKFFEQNEKGEETWSDFGKFSDSDVHHQVAIVFQTPAYRDRNIEKPVKVQVQLFRQNDRETSDTLEFTYKPRDKDPEHIHSKRRRLNDADDDFSSYGGHQDFSSHQQHPFCPPGPPHWQDGSGNSSNSMMQHHGHGGYQMNQMALFVNHFAEDLRMSSSSPSSSQDSFLSAQSEPECVSVANSIPNIPTDGVPTVPADAVPNVPPDTVPAENPVQDPSFEKIRDAVLPFQVENMENCTLFEELDPVEMDSTATFQMADLTKAIKSLKVSKEEDLLQPNSEASRSRRGSRSKASLQVTKPHASKQDQPSKPQDRERSDSRSKPVTKKPDAQFKSESARGSQSSRRSSDSGTRATIESFVKRKMIPSFGQSLRRFTSTGRIQPLLWSLAPFIASQNEEGDNAVHLAVIHQPENQGLFEQLMPIVNSLMPYDVVNHSNNNYQTPLHLAVAVQEVKIVTWLLFCKADPNLQDYRGNTPVHLAVLKRAATCLDILLDKSNYRNQSSVQAYPNINILNFDGYSALHLSVLLGCKSCLSHLLEAEANVNIRDGTSGRTPLHMAVEMESPLIEELLKQTSIDVNAQDYAGNTPLNLACSMELLDVAHTLIRAAAKPLVRNFTWSFEEVNEEEEEDNCDDNDEEPRGQTAFDLAKGNDKLLSILRGTLSEVEETGLQTSRRRSRDEQIAKTHKSGSIPTDQGFPELSRTFHAASNVLSPKEPTSTTHDSGYGDSGLLMQDSCFDSKETDSLVTELCALLDPPNKHWEKLALVVFEEATVDSMRKLTDSPTLALLKKIKELRLILKDALEAAGLWDICRQLPNLEQRALNI